MEEKLSRAMVNTAECELVNLPGKTWIHPVPVLLDLWKIRFHCCAPVRVPTPWLSLCRVLLPCTAPPSCAAGRTHLSQPKLLQLVLSYAGRAFCFLRTCVNRPRLEPAAMEAV